ncbi:MAG TPA: hypothetical protein VHC69_06805 [Polyangiaceae bacterium]|nr:hypothetical protein [Polyangiaceae bacterium]
MATKTVRRTKASAKAEPPTGAVPETPAPTIESHRAELFRNVEGYLDTARDYLIDGCDERNENSFDAHLVMSAMKYMSLARLNLAELRESVLPEAEVTP